MVGIGVCVYACMGAGMCKVVFYSVYSVSTPGHRVSIIRVTWMSISANKKARQGGRKSVKSVS